MMNITTEIKKVYRLYIEKNPITGELDYFEIYKKQSPTKEKLVERGIIKQVAVNYLEELTGWNEKTIKEAYPELN